VSLAQCMQWLVVGVCVCVWQAQLGQKYRQHNKRGRINTSGGMTC
jgi:hypothetical protein